MDQLDRNLRRRLDEKTARHRLGEAERHRDQPHLMGYVEDDAGIRRPLLAVVVAMVLVIVAVIAYVELTQPPGQHPALADEPAWGTATDQDTLVQPPAWWPSEP